MVRSYFMPSSLRFHDRFGKEFRHQAAGDDGRLHFMFVQDVEQPPDPKIRPYSRAPSAMKSSV
jgi:hypothetical protein